MRYRIEVTKAAARDLRALPANILKRVDARILSLGDQPRPDGVKKLVGSEDLYRIRVGDYRIVYEIQDAIIVVSIIRVRHADRDGYCRTRFEVRHRPSTFGD